MGTTIRETVTLSPKTVSKAERLAREIEASKKANPRKRASRVEKISVHPKVWSVAMKLSDGNVSRIKVQSETCVVVVNS